MKNKTLIVLPAMLLFGFCGSSNKPVVQTETETETTQVKKDSVVLTFAFVGCNRVDRQQLANPGATDASSANLSALKRIYRDISGLDKKPALFFFLGDLVCAETTTQVLNGQLNAWCKLYNDTGFSKISRSGIEMVAVPGNHEMLYYKNVNIKGHDEWPLKGSTAVWMNYMKSFIPKDSERITGADSLVNQMTFSFVRKNVAFVVMNTDTYNPPTKANPYGLEGIVPSKWILDKIKQYRANPAIQHIFVLGHKPYYVNNQPATGHDGLPEGPVLWPAFNSMTVAAMLSAHVHDYERMQPGNAGTYQIIAGNGGSKGPAAFFGYTLIQVMSNGELKLISRGFDVGNPYYQDVPANPFKVRDSTVLSWTKNANPYNNQ